MCVGRSKVAVSPSLQGRVLTSCSDEDEEGYGWLNHSLIKSQEHQAHFNAFGGEDRFWIGPEAGQFALFFRPGEEFSFENWQTPACIDSEAFSMKWKNDQAVGLFKACELINYQNEKFTIEIDRNIEILSRSAIGSALYDIDLNNIECLGFSSVNEIKNTSSSPWQKNTGLLNIWILGQFKSSPSSWSIIPTKRKGVINQNYFHADISTRLMEENEFSLLKVDGRLKSKIGVSPREDKNVLGSFDLDSNILTVVRYETNKDQDFLNSEWKIQKEPYAGDILNVYNDGPNDDGSILGPYYELETSSSSRELRTGEHISHKHTTFHFSGTFKRLNEISKRMLGVDLNSLKSMVNAR